MVPWYALARLYGWSCGWCGIRAESAAWGFCWEGFGGITSSRPRDCVSISIISRGCYDALVARKRFGESETHRFLASLLREESIGTGVVFLDVGANIGELSLDLARHPKVESVIAFEPNAECARSLPRARL